MKLPETLWGQLAAFLPVEAGPHLLEAMAVRAHPRQWLALRKGDPFWSSRLRLRFDLLKIRERLAYAYAAGCARRLARAQALHLECSYDLERLVDQALAYAAARERAAQTHAPP